MANYNTDICVIAAGPAGLSAAVQAAQNGASVLVLEKAAIPGGAANMGMGPLGIGTRYQKNQMYYLSVEKAFNMFMEYTHYNADARLIKRYFSQSAETIEWLEDLGVEFEGAFRYFPKSEATWHIVKTDHGIGPRAASFMNKALLNELKNQGVEILTETPAEHIVIRDGKVAGVLAKDKDGNTVEVACKAAIIATGGAGCNPEMIHEETGYIFAENMFNFAIPGITGDGLRMAWEAGADKVPIRVEQASQLMNIAELPLSVANVFLQPNLLVNKFGRRFMNEDEAQNSTFLSNAISKQKGMRGYMIIDSSIARYYIKHGLDVISLVHNESDVSDFFEGIQSLQNSNVKGFVIADTIEELAEKLGIDADKLQETVDDYNDYCDSVDEEFFKDRRYLRPIVKAPFYAATYAPGGYGTVGGIRINENCEVCDKEFAPIPGLYAAGADACNIYDDSYMFLLPGNSMGFAVNTGRIAGMEAAEYVNE